MDYSDKYKNIFLEWGKKNKINKISNNIGKYLYIHIKHPFNFKKCIQSRKTL